MVVDVAVCGRAAGGGELWRGVWEEGEVKVAGGEDAPFFDGGG